MTRLVRFANNAVSRLAAGITNSATSLSVTPGDGAKFPSLSGSRYFMATLVRADGTTEVVKVTARSTDTMTIVRGSEAVGGASTAYSFSAGDRVENRLTSGVLDSEIDRLDAAALIGTVSKTANYSVLEADISTLIRVDTTSGTITVTLPQISTLVDDFHVIVGKVSSDTNTVSLVRAGSDTINGATSYALSAQYQAAWLIADRTNNVWTVISSGSTTNNVVDAYTGDGVVTALTLSGSPGTKNNTTVIVGGVAQLKSTYSLSGATLTLGAAPGVGVLTEVWWSQPNTIGTPSDATVTAAKLANAGYELGMRNRIINGGMVIDQRATAVTATGYAVDRWWFNASDDATKSVAVNTDAPAGFSSSLRCTVSVADATIGAIQYCEFDHFIEGYNIADLGFGTAGAQSVTLSFWVRSSVTGVYTGNIGNSDSSRLCPFNYSISVANTWERKTVTFTGCTDGTWNSTTGIGLAIKLNMALGSSFLGGTAGTWNSTSKFGSGTPVNALATNGNIFAVTGVQLERGSSATPFEYRPYGTELALCQRYYEVGQATDFYNFSGGTVIIGTGTRFLVPKRAAPTMTVSYGSLQTITAIGFQSYGSISSANWYQSVNFTATAEL